MKPKTFAIILFAVLIVGIAVTTFHLIHAVNAYQHASVVEFIAREIW